MTLEKIQKVLANAGIASRRKVESMISEGRITVDGKQAKIGDRITNKANVTVDGKKIDLIPKIKRKILIYHKPEGEICSRVTEPGKPSVFDHLPELDEGRWISIGRLDVNTSGLLIFTNDGDYANYLMHPSSDIEREYKVRIYGDVTEEIIKKLKRGVKLEDGIAKFTSIKPGSKTGKNQWFNVVLKEGRNREVRRLWESQGVKVNRLMRIRFGEYVLPRSLNPGEYEYF